MAEMDSAAASASVLLVDDDPLIHELVEQFLGALPLHFDHAYSGEQALRAAAICTPTLVLLDVCMPAMDGFETCRRLRSEPALARVPVLFITAAAEGEAVAQAFAAGGNDYVRKPIEPVELRARVGNHLLLAQAQERDLARLRDNDKLARLGELVGGMGHELATPIGNAKLAVDALGTSLGELHQDRLAGRLTASSLDRFLAQGGEAVAIAERALAFAAQLLGSFKTIAVDQCAGRRQVIRLYAYLEQVLLSLRPRLKRSRVEVLVNGPRELELDTEPGAIAQIVANLVNNSLLHGYAADQPGCITIDFTAEVDDLLLRYRDDGCGMPPDVAARIFEAYFTTRAGSGGSGLGMHIVHHLVCERLGGTITCESAVGRGVCLTMRLPWRAATGA